MVFCAVNESNSFSVCEWYGEIYQIKAKDSEIKPYPLYLGNI